MLRPTILILVLFAGAIFGAPVPKEVKRNDEQAILGTWEMVLSSHYAKDPARPTETILWRFDGAGRGVVTGSTETVIGYELLPAESAGAPPSFDYRWGDSLLKGLYRLDGDTLRIAVDSTAISGGCRPAVFMPVSAGQ